jgi:iron(III) transport system ATP-binding protein
MVSIRGLCKNYATPAGEVRAVESVDLHAAEGEFVSLLGPSGSGKTTTLRCVAGLEDGDEGEIQIGPTVVSSPARGVYVPPYHRDIGMVFQSYAIWPHLDVFTNVAYPLQVRRPRPSPAEISRRAMEALALVGMQEFARRPATTLSGGEQQRVALARAVVNRPRLLLLDEPLANLDARLRAEMQREVSALVRRLGVTTLAVTHDQAEAMAMADRIVVMDAGRVVECDTPRNLYERPRTAFVAGFLGANTGLTATIEHVGAGGVAVVVLDDDAGRLRVHGAGEYGPGQRLELALHPDELALVGDGHGAIDNTIRGTVERLVFRGASLECHLRCGSRLVRATLPSRGDDHAVSVGSVCRFSVDPARCIVLRPR